ncbi:MAG: type II secretion system F family protein [Anaerolineae bacterium]|nr:type II secretion system F family protein [Anaerolineae bacterium]
MPNVQGGLTTTGLVLAIAGFLVVGIIIALVIVARRRPKGEADLEARLAMFSERDTPVTLEEIELSASFAERVVYPTIDAVSKFIGQFTPARTLEKIRHRLELAGNPGNLRAPSFIAIQFLAMLVLGGLILAMTIIAELPMVRRILFTVLSMLAGYFLPSLWLASRISRRQAEITRELPDMLDLLTICVEAGLGLDQGIQRVVEKQDTELSRELNRYLQEVQLGRTRAQALQGMASRIDVADVTTFVAAIIQADQLGVAMSKILRIQSDQMRVRRRQRAEQKAHQAPIKMLFPLAFLIFPSIFIVLLGPALLQLMESEVLGSII